MSFFYFGRLCVDLFVKYLKKNRTKSKGGFTWGDYYFKHRENKYGVNMGLAHGIPGILKLLTLIYKYSNDKNTKKETKELISRIIIFLKNFASPNNEIAYSYYFIPESSKNETKINTRLAWCYGDLSIAFVIYQTGMTLHDATIIDFANELLDKTVSRRLQSITMVQDAGLCHGSSGLFHMYNILFNYIGSVELKRASEFWLSEVINYCNESIKSGTYKKFNPINKTFDIDNGFLEGASGIGLSLITFLTGDRYWDQCLLLNE